MLLNNECVNNKIKEEIKRYLEINEHKNTTTPKSMGQRKSGPKREIQALQAKLKLSKSSNKQSNFTLKRTSE